MRMTEKKRLVTEDFSNVSKDENSTLSLGQKIDLVEHLARQHLSKEWICAKEDVIETMNATQRDDAHEIKILDIGCGL
jgi:hypothetical protein